MDPLQLVRFVKHGCVCFEQDDVVIYVDPYGIEDRPQDADLVIITHSHGDHYSPQDIARVKKEDTCFATTAEVSSTAMYTAPLVTMEGRNTAMRASCRTLMANTPKGPLQMCIRDRPGRRAGGALVLVPPFGGGLAHVRAHGGRHGGHRRGL